MNFEKPRSERACEAAISPLTNDVCEEDNIFYGDKEDAVRVKGLAMPSAQLKQRRYEDYGFHLEYRTRWSDNDMYDHMNNAIYWHLIDSVVNGYLIERCGHCPPTSPQIGLVVHSSSDYFGSVGFPSVVDLGLRVNKLGTSSVTYEIGIFERGKKDVRVVGGYTHVFVERETNRPAASGMPGEIRQGLEKLLVDGKPKL